MFPFFLFCHVGENHYLCSVEIKQQLKHKTMDVYDVYSNLVEKKEELEKKNLPVPQELLDEIEEARMDIIREEVEIDIMIDMRYGEM